MHNKIPFDKEANHESTDFKAEIIAAALIEQGYNPELISILHEGTARRGFSTEVEDIEIRFSEKDFQEYLQIRANKEGLYDMLPQGLFHKPVHKRGGIDKEEMLDEIKIHRMEEFFARKFFRVFEELADDTLFKACTYVTKYNKKMSNREFIDLFIIYWPILNLLEHKQAIFFMHIIPILHKVRTHHKYTEEALSCILDVPVLITNIHMPAKKADLFFESTLGENRLGVGLVLGNQFDDGDFDLKITIGPIPSKRMLGFLETAKEYRLLTMLCKLFLPAGCFVEKEFLIIPEDSNFILSNEDHHTFLGINSYL